MKRLLLLGGLIAGCGIPTDAGWHPSGSRYAPHAAYAEWWEEVQSCVGLEGDLARVAWFAVPGYRFYTPQGYASGRWVSPHDIYVAEAHVESESIVKHEMVHDLIQAGGHEHAGFACVEL